jgi:endogenous inhibitor of DNA gyrase (YacG/DUF329 family)
MQTDVRQAFWETYEQFGQDICEQPKRLEGLLLDACGNRYREIKALMTAVELVLTTMQADAGRSLRDTLVERLTRRLCDERGLQEDLARWAVEALAVAAGVLRKDQARAELPELSTAQAAAAAPTVLGAMPPARKRACPKCGQSFDLPPAGTVYYAACPFCLTIVYAGPRDERVRPRMQGERKEDGTVAAEGNCPACGQFVQLAAPKSSFYAPCPQCTAKVYLGP